jgi:hypothetical protein
LAAGSAGLDSGATAVDAKKCQELGMGMFLAVDVLPEQSLYEAIPRRPGMTKHDLVGRWPGRVGRSSVVVPLPRSVGTRAHVGANMRHLDARPPAPG